MEVNSTWLITSELANQSKSTIDLCGIHELVDLDDNNAAEGENNIKYASSYRINWTVKNWIV